MGQTFGFDFAEAKFLLHILNGKAFKLHSRFHWPGLLDWRRATAHLQASACFKPNAKWTIKQCLRHVLLRPLYLVTGQACGGVWVGGVIMPRLLKPTEDTELLDREDSLEASPNLQLISGAALGWKCVCGNSSNLLLFNFQKDSFKLKMATDIKTYINDLHTNRNMNNKSCYKNNLLLTVK